MCATLSPHQTKASVILVKSAISSPILSPPVYDASDMSSRPIFSWQNYSWYCIHPKKMINQLNDLVLPCFTPMVSDILGQPKALAPSTRLLRPSTSVRHPRFQASSDCRSSSSKRPDTATRTKRSSGRATWQVADMARYGGEKNRYSNLQMEVSWVIGVPPKLDFPF